MKLVPVITCAIAGAKVRYSLFCLSVEVMMPKCNKFLFPDYSGTRLLTGAHAHTHSWDEGYQITDKSTHTHAHTPRLRSTRLLTSNFSVLTALLW